MNSSLILCSVLSAGLLTAASPAANPPRVSYLPLPDKGVSGEKVAKSANGYRAARPTPRATFISAAELSKMQPANAKQREREVEFTIVERSGTEQRDLPFSFGFPIPQGELYHLENLSLTSVAENASPLPLQAHALALWPDGSVKSALLQTRLNLKAGEKQNLKVAYGPTRAKRDGAGYALKVHEGKDQWVISTGKIRVTLPTAKFSLFSKVESDTQQPTLLAKGGALELENENRISYSSIVGPVESLLIERKGPLEAMLRAEGSFHSRESGQKLMRYIARMRFFAGSSRVELAVTIVNNSLKNEFTDLRSLEIELDFPASGTWSATILTGDVPEEKLEGSGPLVLSQWEEQRQELTGGVTKEATGMAPGSIHFRHGDSHIQLAYKDFWQRWPKQLSTEAGRLRINLLPRLPERFEASLPTQLQFPFVEGCHRLKWGMSFTERFAIDFDASAALASIQGSVQTPPLVHLPISYVVETKALGSLPTQENEMTNLWRRYSERSMEAFLAQRREARQYGYLNWGDWYGERGCNWGNNEYDIPHGFFAQYLFTGDAKYFDAAQEGARHQADVDIVHAYPDPFYIGANVQHSIGHTGISYQEVDPRTWTYQYDVATWGGNGHTWADGMADCWLLTGDPVVMDSLLALGEHLTFAYIPAAKTMGNHHRSIGWCLQALAAVYRVSPDKAHLEALKTLARLPIETWDAKSGIWPYELHPNHALGESNIIGCSVYNLGILLQGLVKCHELTGDERILKILSGASDWLVSAWQDNRGWPYGARIDGSLIAPGQRLAENLNPLIYPPLAYTAWATKHPRAGDVARGTLLATFGTLKYDQLPKEFSIKCNATLETIGLLEKAAHQETPTK